MARASYRMLGACVAGIIALRNLCVVSRVMGRRSTRKATRFRADDASALSDARFGEVVGAGAVFCARSIKPLEGSRPRLRRTRAMEIEWGRYGCGASGKLCGRTRQMMVRAG